MKGLAVYLGLVEQTEHHLAARFGDVAADHAVEGLIPATATLLASWSADHVRLLGPPRERYGDEPSAEAERLHATALERVRSGPVGLSRDLQELHLLASLADTTWIVVLRAARGARDTDLETVALRCGEETRRQLVPVSSSR